MSSATKSPVESDYAVHFDAPEVWGDKGVKTDTLRVDLFDDYLEPCG